MLFLLAIGMGINDLGQEDWASSRKLRALCELACLASSSGMRLKNAGHRWISVAFAEMKKGAFAPLIKDL